MIKIKVDGVEKQMATTWEELNFGTFLELVEVKDDYQAVLAIMLGEPVEKIKRAKIDGLEKLVPQLKFLQEPALIDENPVKLGEFIFPRDATIQTLEQFEITRKYINEAAKTGSIKRQTEALAMYAAIYCQPTQGEFDEEKAQYLAEQFKSYPCLEVMSAGSFFMAKCLSMWSGSPMSYLRKNTPMKKSKQDSKRFQILSGLGRLWTRLRVTLGSLMMR